MCFAKASALKPGNYEYLNNQCAANINDGNFAAAKINIKKTLELNQYYFLAYYNYGYLLEKMNNTKDAIKNYKKCLELSPDYFDAQERLAALEEADI